MGKSTLVEWIEKGEGAARLGVSERRLLEFTAAEKIRSRPTPGPGGGRRRLQVHAGDVERLCQERDEKRSAGKVRALAKTDPAVRKTTHIQEVLALTRAAVAPPAQLPPAPAPRLWLTLDEAAEYCGLPSAELRDLVIDGTLPSRCAGRHGGPRVRRADVDAIEGTLPPERAMTA